MHSFARSQNNAMLHSLMPVNELWINTDAARDLGLSESQNVLLQNLDGISSLPIKLRLTQGIRRDSVYMVHGFGHRSPWLRLAYKQGASDTQLLTRVQVDPIMGGTGMRVNFVRLLTTSGKPLA
jgi:thiosulfate reductase/polysulfide reductase chain A